MCLHDKIAEIKAAEDALRAKEAALKKQNKNLHDKISKIKATYDAVHAKEVAQRREDRIAYLKRQEEKAERCVEMLIDKAEEDLSYRGIAYLVGSGEELFEQCFELGVDVRIIKILDGEGITVKYYPTKCIVLYFTPKRVINLTSV